jgi:hypothetical protein
MAMVPNQVATSIQGRLLDFLSCIFLLLVAVAIVK